MAVKVNDINDMCFRHDILKWQFELDVDKWDTIDPDVKKLISTEWKMVKYTNDDGTKLSEEFNRVPDDKGGIYLFVLSPEIIPEYPVYIMYIGRARRKQNFSLRQRCRTYIKERERQKVEKMMRILGRRLYLRYLPLENDEDIEKVERELIRVLLPPCNDRYPDYNFLPEKPAF